MVPAIRGRGLRLGPAPGVGVGVGVAVALGVAVGVGPGRLRLGDGWGAAGVGLVVVGVGAGVLQPARPAPSRPADATSTVRRATMASIVVARSNPGSAVGSASIVPSRGGGPVADLPGAPRLPPTPRAVRSLRWLLWPIAVVLSLAVVGQASFAAFDAKVSNSGNNFGVGSVNLADDDAGSALFTVSNLKPGSSGSRCITVTSTGTLPATVKLYTTDATTTKALASYISLTITQGTGGQASNMPPPHVLS